MGAARLRLTPFRPSPYTYSRERPLSPSYHPLIDSRIHFYLCLPKHLPSPLTLAEKGAIPADTPYRFPGSSPFLSYVCISPWLWFPWLSLLIFRHVSLNRNYKVSNLPPYALPTFVSSFIGLLSNCLQPLRIRLSRSLFVVSLCTLRGSTVSRCSERCGLTCFNKNRFLGSIVTCFG